MDPPPYFPGQSFTAQDFETASIHSTAPSYVSNAPTYVSTLRAPTSTRSSSGGGGGPPYPYQHNLSPSSLRHSRANSIPSLDTFRMSTWPRTTTPNPAARHYHSVAHRRASALTIQEQQNVLLAALNGEDGIAQMKKRMDEEERQREMRTLEDPYLVGEEAAEKNRQERLKRENGWDVLEREDKRWDWLLAQMSDWEERDKSWKKFRREIEGGKGVKLARRLGLSKKS